MKIVAISDTHSKHRSVKIPEADILVCAGDITFKGELNIIEDFCDWMRSLPIKHKICIFGNHEVGMSIDGHKKRKGALKALSNANIHYLQDSGIEIEGLKFWGSPVQPRFFNWEWNRDRGKDIDKHWQMIPDDTNVLITHGPPYGIQDIVELSPFEERDPHQGCADLLRKVSSLEHLKLHIFGHIHGGHGTAKYGPCTFVNAAICTDRYEPTNPAIVIDL